LPKEETVSPAKEERALAHCRASALVFLLFDTLFSGVALTLQYAAVRRHDLSLPRDACYAAWDKKKEPPKRFFPF